MKVIIIGASLSGKTTLIRYLQSRESEIPIEEMDALLTRENGGVFPIDINRKNELAREVVRKILTEDKIIFFTNTDYFTLNDLFEAKRNGFKIIQLVLEIEELQKRNKYRSENKGYEDLSQWLGGMIRYQKEIKDAGLVDKILDAKLSPADLASEFMRSIK